MIAKKIATLFSLPTLWRYFLVQYIKVFSLSFFGFLAILLSMRLEDFAHFLSLGADLPATLLYLIYQIPYVLQIALPISSLIASLYLFQKLSQTSALTSLRAAGISLLEIIAPLILFSITLALITFYLVLDVSANSHKHAKELEFQLRSMNPLALMHNSRAMEEKGFNVDMKGSLQRDGKATDFIMAIRNNDSEKIALFLAKKMRVEGDKIIGTNLAFISSFENAKANNEGAKLEGTKLEEANHFDHLVIENSKENIIQLEDLSKAVNTKRLRLSNDDMKLALLVAKKNDMQTKVEEKKFLGQSKRYVGRLLTRVQTEILRRISLSLSIVTFALLGVAFGTTFSRTHSRKRLLYALLLTSFFLLCFLGAKGMEGNVEPASVLYFLPHIVLIALSCQRLLRMQKGVLTS